MDIKSIPRVAMLTTLLALPSLAFATSTTELVLSEITQASTNILTGEIIESQAITANKAATETLVTVRVTDEIKGNTAEMIQIRIPGGSFKRGRFQLGETHAGIPQVFANQKNLYFLTTTDKDNVYQIADFLQGSVKIESSPEGEMVNGKLTGGQAIPMSEMKSKITNAEGQ